MANQQLFPLTGLAITLFILYKIFRKLQARRHESYLTALHGCEPAVRFEDPWGLRVFKIMGTYAKSGKWALFGKDMLGKHPGTHTIETRSLGRTAFMTSDPGVVKAVLAGQFDNFGIGRFRKESIQPLIGSGIFTQNGHVWRNSRKMLAPSFDKQQISNLEDLEKHIQALAKAINKQMKDGKVELEALFHRLSLDASTGLLFGESVNTLEGAKENDEDVAAAWELAGSYFSKRARAGPLYFLVNPPEFRRAIKKVHQYADRFVDAAVNRYNSKFHSPANAREKTPEKDERYVFLDLLVQETQNREVLRSQTLNILIAGRDTTSGLLAFTFLLLRNHPRVLKKLRDEIADVLEIGGDKRKPTYEQLNGLKYLQYVLRESHRLYPVVPHNGRECVKTTVLPSGGGPDGTKPLLVRAGDRITYSAMAMHRRRDLYGDDADEFYPERWEKNGQLRNIRWGFLPFGGGPRVCLGQRFATTMAAYTVVRLVQMFSLIERADNPAFGELEEELKYRPGLTTTVDSGVWVRMEQE